MKRFLAKGFFVCAILTVMFAANDGTAQTLKDSEYVSDNITLNPHLPNAVQGIPYSSVIKLSPDGNLALIASGLPAGLTMDLNGRISGVPIVRGIFIVEVTAFERSPIANETIKRFLLQVIDTPDAASTSVSGRVLSDAEVGIPNAHVTITNQNGESETVVTNQLGYYCFYEVTVGETYVFTVRAKGYQFSPSAQVHTIIGETEDINFVGSR